jgi:hypothetical protein
MRMLSGLVGVAMAGSATVLLPGRPASAVCSVFDKHPCTPSVCSVFRRGPCIPQIDYPIGQDLRLTIESGSQGANALSGGLHDGFDPSDHAIETLGDLFVALRACWIPPAKDEARPGMQMSVRFAFKRTGEIIATPRVTYSTPDAPRQARETYHRAISAALDRCTPLHFTGGLGGAVAGRPIAIRFVDNRDMP